MRRSESHTCLSMLRTRLVSCCSSLVRPSMIDFLGLPRLPTLLLLPSLYVEPCCSRVQIQRLFFQLSL